jgi:hypothetical protein
MLRRALNFIAVVLVCLFVVSPSVVAATGDGFQIDRRFIPSIRISMRR